MAEKTKPLVCAQCGYANEGERVYCHNCGNKLDRSLLPAQGQAEEPLAKKQRRIRKTVTPKKGFSAGMLKAFLYIMLSSLLAAVLMLVVLPPDDVPSPAKSDELPDTSPTMALEDALGKNAPTPLLFKENDINGFLASKVKDDGNGALGNNIKTVRAFVKLDEDQLRFTTDQTVLGLHIYTSAYYKLAVANNKLDATVTGGTIGR